uniref:Uncharacterized protein n=1 Tax=Sinocyclocheilus rhinocerous TaxID=307959 RepID=A0A673L753_9TELE
MCLHALTSVNYETYNTAILVHSMKTAFVLSGAYAAVIFLGCVFMKDRQKLDLWTPLMLWSLCLALFRCKLRIMKKIIEFRDVNSELLKKG